MSTARALAAALAALAVAGPAAALEPPEGASAVDVRQVGERNLARVSAPNPDQAVSVLQEGLANAAELTAADALGGVRVALGQLGDGNTAAFVLAGAPTSFAGVNAQQVGARNRLELDQNVSGAATALLRQDGEGNHQKLRQEGVNLSAELTQVGDDNRLSASQVGADLALQATQIGSGLPALVIEQIGRGVPGAAPVVVTQVR